MKKIRREVMAKLVRDIAIVFVIIFLTFIVVDWILVPFLFLAKYLIWPVAITAVISHLVMKTTSPSTL